ncbi:hypothetical protein AB1Y20_001738 [Prymnesium parvum]|uniref:JmjC domain-containing protein n=1 Tax=Prymnesium parvum TaxID=97485 RepID=A0AB34KC66_PRYPA
MNRSLARPVIVALLAASLYAWRRHAAAAPPHALEAEALLHLFSRAPPLPRDATRATAATIAAAATSRRPAHWPHCVPPEWSAKAWESPDGAARALARLVPWVMARALGSAEFVLSEPTRGARPLLRDASPWEAPLQQERRNVSIAQLLASESESLYYSGTLGEPATAHWRTEAILASLQPLDHLLLHDVPPLRKEEPQPPEGGPAPANQTTLRLWISSKGVASRTHYDKSHNVFTQLSGRKRVLLWPPSSLPELHLYPAIHAAYRQSQIPLRAASGTGPLPEAAMAHYPRASATLAGRTAADAAVAVELVPGGCLYIPPYWAHAVLSVDASVSLSSFSTSWEQARWARSGWRMAPLGRFASSRCSRARGSVILAQAFVAALLPHISHGAYSSRTTRQFLMNLHTSRFAPLYDGKREAASELEELAACLAAPPSQGDPERDPALRRRIDEFAQSVAALLTDMDPEWGRSFDHGIVTELAGDYVEELLGWAGSAGDAQGLLQLLATDDDAVSIL